MLSIISIPLSVIILLGVFILVAFRQKTKLKIWQIVLAGAALVLITGQIGPAIAISYINYTVIIFLICIFIVGGALTESGYIQNLSSRIFRSAKSIDALVISVIFFMGITSMFLLNDTMAVIGVPVVMLFATREHINPKLMLFALMFSITIGSIASPIGSPQNILIASSRSIHSPFLVFFEYLLIPTMVSLLFLYFVLRILYRDEFNRRPMHHEHPAVKDKKLAKLSKISLSIILIFVVMEIILPLLGMPEPSIAVIAVAASLPIIIFSKKRFQIIRGIDWSTILLFISLFVLVGSVWISGFIQNTVLKLGVDVFSVPTIIISNVIGSQFISNVPMVLLYLKLIEYSSVSAVALVALAAGSTIAGNLTIMGAASNIIAIQGAEKRYKQTISFFEFLKIGVLVTLVNILVYWFFLVLI